jgi:hypothetical protein
MVPQTALTHVLIQQLQLVVVEEDITTEHLMSPVDSVVLVVGVNIILVQVLDLDNPDKEILVV